ncbi:MAG TPA: ATP-binding protein [Candidatus Brocadiaceae bacterium]|nr:ATP-binding protein [Candidatus Brocadiaceae bacterium]
MSIRKKLLIVFLCLTLLPALLVGAWIFYTVRASLEKEVFSKLENVADLKVNYIEGFLKERRGDVLTMQTFRVVTKNLPVLNRFMEEKTKPAYRKAIHELDNRLKGYREAYGCYWDIMLLNPDGKVVYCVNKDHAAFEVGKYLREPLRAIYEKGRKEIFSSNVYRDEIIPEQFLMMITAPVHDSKGVSIGELAFEVDMEMVYKQIQDVAGLGETGETLIGKGIVDGAIFLHSLRHDPSAALKRKVMVGEGKGFPMLKAVQGECGSGFSIDYRGEKVAAAWRYIPSLDCGIVAKIDFSEAIEPMNDVRDKAAVLLIISLFLGGGLVFLVVRTITVPIINLTYMAKRVNEGDLSARVEVASSDEIGVLGRYFNKMTEDLTTVNISLKDHAAKLGAINSELSAANKELESFSYSVSHDLRAPLRAIDGFSNIILEDYRDRLDDEGKRLFSVVRENAKKMGQLIDDILSFSRMGRLETSMQEIDMEQLVKEVYQELATSVPERKIQFNLKSLAPAYGDRPMIRQVIANLISNTLKFTKGREAAVIEVGTITGDMEYGGVGKAVENENIYYVKDNGVGFDMKYVDKLFGVFQRLHSAEEFEGTGIGLAIVKRVITRHGGRTWAQGKVGEGTVVYFTLPAGRKAIGCVT